MEQNKLRNIYILVISNSYSFIPQTLNVVCPLGKKIIFSVNWDLKHERITIIGPQRYLTDKKPTPGRGTVSVSQFSTGT